MRFYPGSGNGLLNGVMDLKLNRNIRGAFAYGGMSGGVEDWTTSELISMGFPLNDYDHIMYILPG